jgi:hypothetical protein
MKSANGDARALEVTHEIPGLELGRPTYQTSPQEAGYRTEVKKVRYLNEKELNRCVDLGTTNFKHQQGLRDFILRYYFSDGDRDLILTYQKDEIVAFHEATILDIKKSKIIDHSFSVVDKEHRRRGIDKRANQLRYEWCIEQGCAYASFKTASPYMAERRMKDGFKNPLLNLVSDDDCDLLEIGLKIGNARGEDIDGNLVVTKNDKDGNVYYSEAKTKPAKNDMINKRFEILYPNQRLRFVRKL